MGRYRLPWAVLAAGWDGSQVAAVVVTVHPANAPDWCGSVLPGFGVRGLAGVIGARTGTQLAARGGSGCRGVTIGRA